MAVYKEISKANLEDRTIKSLSTDTNTKVNTIVSNFVTYFKAAQA